LPTQIGNSKVHQHIAQALASIFFGSVAMPLNWQALACKAPCNCLRMERGDAGQFVVLCNSLNGRRSFGIVVLKTAFIQGLSLPSRNTSLRIGQYVIGSYKFYHDGQLTYFFN
jgi:hypothetical protein